MIQLKAETIYYLYMDSDKIYISDEPPVALKSTALGPMGGFVHPELGYKCYQSIYVDKPDTSGKIQMFYRTNEEG